MNWRGKAIGGSIGSFFGPWGALAGAAVGHVLVDKKNVPTEKQSLRLLAIAAGALYELARMDGRYTAKEDATIRSVLSEINQRLGIALRPHELAYLIDDASRIDRSFMRLAATVRDNPPLARASVIWLWRVAVCDADETHAEIGGIAAFTRAAGLSDDEAFQASLLYRRVAATASDEARRAACGVLGIPYAADADAIKSAYRAMSLKYHPDKHADLDPDIRALTAEKFAQIKAAYDTLGGTSQHVGDWYAKQADTGTLASAVPDLVACCFLCGQKVRLPPRERLASARCPVCQALLALDRNLAEQLA